MSRYPVRAPDIPAYTSPEVLPDSRAVIRLHHPQARAVTCVGEWASPAPIPLQRGPDGLWSCTTPPLAPDIYEYCLYADGARILDYQNPDTKNRFISLLRVPAPDSLFEPRPVPRGAVHVRWYPSAATGAARRLHLYTPPGYELDPARHYPILYLLHGAGDDDESWVRIGRLHVILDNLIADGRALPMLVAMPLGHVSSCTDWRLDRRPKIDAFTADFHQSLLTHVERHYRVQPGREARAIAGLSMGGGQVIAAGLTRPDLFGAFGIFSSGLWPELTPLLDPALDALRAAPPRLLWIGIGRRDFLFEHCALLRRTLGAAAIPFIYHEDDTAHSWRAWRKYLELFASLLFR